MSNFITTMAFIPDPPLRIEREFGPDGAEFIIIEGVRYAADYFRAFSHPETDKLYQVQMVNGFLRLVQIENVEQAQEFFENA